MSQLSGEQMLVSLGLLGFLDTVEREQSGLIRTGLQKSLKCFGNWVEMMESAHEGVDGPSLLSLNPMALQFKGRVFTL